MPTFHPPPRAPYPGSQGEEGPPPGLYDRRHPGFASGPPFPGPLQYQGPPQFQQFLGPFQVRNASMALVQDIRTAYLDRSL